MLRLKDPIKKEAVGNLGNLYRTVYFYIVLPLYSLLPLSLSITVSIRVLPALIPIVAHSPHSK